jgi:hypothetical protein
MICRECASGGREQQVPKALTAPSSPWKPAAMLAAGAIVIVIGILAVTVWPTLYRYDHANFGGGDVLVRIHRFSGKTEGLAGSGRGWVDLSPSSKPTPLPSDQLAKLTGGLVVTTYGSLSERPYILADIYNGTERALDTVTVEVTVLDGSGAPVLRRICGLTRRYSPTYGGPPLSSSEFTADCGFSLATGQTYQWRIVSATWK